MHGKRFLGIGVFEADAPAMERPIGLSGVRVLAASMQASIAQWIAGRRSDIHVQPMSDTWLRVHETEGEKHRAW